MTPRETKALVLGVAIGMCFMVAATYITGCNHTTDTPTATEKSLPMLPAPEIIGMSSIDGRMTFSCTEVEGAEGYGFQAVWSGGQLDTKYTGRPFASFNSLSAQTIKVRAAAIDSNGEYGEISLFSREYATLGYKEVERKVE
jgi:hypothetical protein